MAELRSVEAFVEALGSGAPAPGGGAACALAGALGAALAEMVANFTVGRARYAGVEGEMRAALEGARAARAALLELMEADERAFAAVAAAYALPKGDDALRAAREEAIAVALRAALGPPLEVMRQACAAVGLAVVVAELGNGTVVSDAGCAALLGEAATRAAALNVYANLALLRDEALTVETRAAVEGWERLAAMGRERALALTRGRLGV